MYSTDDRFRIDFIFTPIKNGKKPGSIRVRIEPDPRRYNWVEKNGIRFLYDKFDKTYFTESHYLNLIKQAQDIPITLERPEIIDAEKYVLSRKKKIIDQLSRKIQSGPPIDKSEEFLSSLKKDKHGFVILSLDIVGSTQLAIKLSPDNYTRLISTVLNEINEIIPLFKGFVLKNTGDGIIAFFPEPSFIIKHDMAIDCALTLRRLIYQSINPILNQEKFPTIEIRIGLESGNASVTTIGSPKGKIHKDIIDLIVNLAAKIQSIAKPGSIYFGNTIYRNLHVMWKEVSEQVKDIKNWKYKDSNGQPYRIYKISDNKIVKY